MPVNINPELFGIDRRIYLRNLWIRLLVVIQNSKGRQENVRFNP